MDNLIWDYTVNTNERREILLKRANNKRYLERQELLINTYKDSFDNLKEIIEEIFLVRNVDDDQIKILQNNLKDKICVNKFIIQFSKYAYKWGFSPHIV